MSGPPRSATVLNTTVLSNFAHVDEVELLFDLPRVVTVAAVREELEDGAENHPYLTSGIAALDAGIPVFSLSDTEGETETALLKTLDPGEAQALAVAEIADGIFVTDDGDARRTAKQRDVEITGSIGLLVRFVDNGRISSETADSHLKRWIDEAGFRSPSRDFAVFLEE